MTDTRPPPHPGTIVFIDGNTSKVVAEEKISETTEKMYFVELDEDLVPVVKVIATAVGNRRTIREYGPGDRLLRSTLQIRDVSDG